MSTLDLGSYSDPKTGKPVLLEDFYRKVDLNLNIAKSRPSNTKNSTELKGNNDAK